MLERAWSAGVDRIIITATNAAEAREALALARTDGVQCTRTFVLRATSFQRCWAALLKCRL